MATLEINGTQISYEDRGTGAVLILLHGVWMSSRFFRAQIDALSKSHRVIALDFRGHGESAGVDHGHTVPQYARDLHGLIDALALGRVSLLGWSMGAFVIWDYIKQFGSHGLESIVVVDESASDFRWTDWPLGFADFPTLIHLMESVQTDQSAVADQFIPLMFKDPPSEQDAQWMKREIMRLSPVVANSILFDQTTRDYRDMLGDIDVPTLLCFGADEKLVPVAAGEHLRSAIPKSELVVFEQSGHCPFPAMRVRCMEKM